MEQDQPFLGKRKPIDDKSTTRKQRGDGNDSEDSMIIEKDIEIPENTQNNAKTDEAEANLIGEMEADLTNNKQSTHEKDIQNSAENVELKMPAHVDNDGLYYGPNEVTNNSGTNEQSDRTEQDKNDN